MLCATLRLAPLSVAVYLLFVPISLLMTLLSYVLSPLLAAISLLVGPQLPGVLQWFSTLDADLDGGIKQGVAGYRSDLKDWRLWWQRTCWICRNPAHGWQSELLGMPADGSVIVRQVISETHKNQWYVMETVEGFRFFCWKRDQSLFGGYYSQDLARLGEQVLRRPQPPLCISDRAAPRGPNPTPTIWSLP